MLMVLLRHVIQTKLVSIIRCRLLRSESTTCMLVNKTLVVTISLRTYSLVFASMRTHLLIALGVPALTL